MVGVVPQPVPDGSKSSPARFTSAPQRHHPPPPNGTGWADRAPTPHLRSVRPVPTSCGPAPVPTREVEMADEQHPNSGALQRALSRPVRAMSRMLNNSAALTDKPPSASAERSAIVDCALYIDGVRQPGERNYAEALHAARRHRGFVWIGLKEPQAAEMAAIAETFQLHELAVEDAVLSRQRPKVEQYGEMIFLTMRTARYVEHDELTDTSEVVETGDVLMFIGEHFVITVRHGDASRLAP